MTDKKLNQLPEDRYMRETQSSHELILSFSTYIYIYIYIIYWLEYFYNANNLLLQREEHVHAWISRVSRDNFQATALNWPKGMGALKTCVWKNLNS